MGASSSSIIPTGGLRVHRVYPNGPGEAAGIEVFFDYILEADHNSYNDDSDDTLMRFTSYVSSCEDQEITLNIYNARKKSVRLVTLVPKKWEGVGLLGLSVKFSEFTAMDEGAHVIMVQDGSPAHKAGLIPMTDYLLGTNLQLFVDVDCVRVHVGEHVDEDITLFVYNSITETIRKTVITPKGGWGGKGTLGCNLASGYIHKIPLIKGIWSVPPSEKPSIDHRDNFETIDLSATFGHTKAEVPISGGGGGGDGETAEEPYLPPSIVDLHLASIVSQNGTADSPHSHSDQRIKEVGANVFNIED